MTTTHAGDGQSEDEHLVDINCTGPSEALQLLSLVPATPEAGSHCILPCGKTKSGSDCKFCLKTPSRFCKLHKSQAWQMSSLSRLASLRKVAIKNGYGAYKQKSEHVSVDDMLPGAVIVGVVQKGSILLVKPAFGDAFPDAPGVYIWSDYLSFNNCLPLVHPL